MKERLLTVKEFALKHDVSPQAVRYQIEKGNIPYVTKFGIQLIELKTKYKPRKKSKVC